MNLSFYLILIFFLSKSYCLNKDDKPNIESIFTSPNLYEGKKFSVTCQVGNSQNSNLDFEWFLDNKRVITNENVIISQSGNDHSMVIIKKMSLENSGEYTCKVTNSFKQQDIKSLMVKLNVKPKFIIEPNDHQIKLNSLFYTKCEVTAIPKAKIKWIKLLNDGEELVSENEELKFNFTKLEKSDYKCIAENELGKIEKTIKLNYYVAVKVSNCQNKGDKPNIESVFTSPNLYEGKKFSITCQVSNGPVSFNWLLNGNPILYNENFFTVNHDEISMLNIKKMGLEYSGEYTCEAENSSKEKDSKKVVVKLNVKPKFIIEPNDHQIKLNSLFYTKCEVTAIPKAKIKWLKLLNDNDEELVSENEELKLNFTKSEKSDYKCIAENELGKIEKTIKLNYYGNIFFL